MDQAHQTFTYTARNVKDPNRVITFTLYDSHMQVNLTGLLDQAGVISQADEKPALIMEQIKTQAKPMITKMTEKMTEPVHVNDINATLSDGQLKVTLWRRLAGLRLAPIIFNMGKIDNKIGAEAFIKELMKRQAEEEHPGKFFGPLDYWFGWLGIILAIGLLFRWPQQNKE